MFFLAYIGIYRTPAGWYGQEPYLGPAHMWLWQNMGVWDEKIAPKWGGTANAQFRFSVPYVFRACSHWRPLSWYWVIMIIFFIYYDWFYILWMSYDTENLNWAFAVPPPFGAIFSSQTPIFCHSHRCAGPRYGSCPYHPAGVRYMPIYARKNTRIW